MFCYEPFTTAHLLKLKRFQIMEMELDEKDQIVEETEVVDDISMTNLEGPPSETPQLSLNAMTGMSGYQTMTVTRMHDKKLLQILLDSGSTHNLDLEVAKKLGCKFEKITP
ncbi:hypothetical protein Lalb_Chr25g0282211 [Lupinus albus]|uniref:Uncharacterized protein n=1 Tax=Lupinus albus TaxID=3870 RepID=A0A6A4N3R2_LUPAL|nr:hypothetical protein Lalb_Chr25g0282211 [Lupinus albus]